MSKKLTAKELKHYADELRKIAGLAARTRDQVGGESLKRGIGGMDMMEDGGTNREFEEVDLDVLQAEDATVQAAVAALQRISDGTFGRCAECDKLIPRGRLEAVPYALLCIACQEKTEG